jgi:hypothetical protein
LKECRAGARPKRPDSGETRAISGKIKEEPEEERN